jgi:NAD(P)-dependent dehydrogenase (short-subunit alcohol dehydrogenase family)
VVKRFRGKRVVVTGAGSGIGREMVAQFLAEGARVVGADINPAGVPTQATAMAIDVSSEAEVCELIRSSRAVMGGIDILCNNAGIGSTSSVVDETAEHWDRVFAVNVRSVFLGIKYVLPGMLDQGHGVIVNTASVAGLVGLPDRAAYCASKGAVVALTKQVAVQWADAGIRCNCVCPGTVDSPWVATLLEQAEDAGAARRALVARQPMGRLGRPQEIAGAALFLASDEAAFMTGSELVMDGGITAG